MKRIVSLLLTLCLLGVLSVSAASNSPALTYRTSGDNVELTLEGVAQSVTALQVTLELDGSCPDASFTPASGSFYSPDCLVETKNGKTSVTVYLVADSAVSGNGLRLGSLIPGASYRLPSSAGVKLLDRSLTPIASIGQIPLSVPAAGLTAEAPALVLVLVPAAGPAAAASPGKSRLPTVSMDLLPSNLPTRPPELPSL